MRKFLFPLVIVLGLIVIGCGHDDEPVLAPEKAALVFPAKDALCTQGTTTTTNQNSITFKWNSAPNAESYDLTLKNLETGAVSTQSTTNTELAVTVNKGTPYSWYVISKSSQISATAQSDTWKFYNAGPGSVSYAPFPAEAVNPIIGQVVTAVNGKITLDWNGTDVDNDIIGYDVYFGTATNPAVFKSNITESIINNVTVTAGTTYYWKVITKDSKGNTSDSGMLQFSVK